MTLARSVVVPNYQEELAAFVDLLRSLDAGEWERPSRCEGWRVADVAAHVAGSLTDIVNGRIEGQGTAEVTARQVEERRGRTAAELADELEGAAKVGADILATFDDATWEAPAPGGFEGTLGFGIESLWYDVFLHADDIRAAIARPSVPGPGLEASLSHVAEFLDRRGWGPATLALDGTAEYPVGDGTGPHITGDPLAFVLAATGRADPTPLGLTPAVNIYAD